MMTPNYQWRWTDEVKWTDVYVDPKDGSVTETDNGYSYPHSRWVDLESTYNIDTRVHPSLHDSLEEKDNVNSPAHYGQGKIECIEYIQDFLTKEEFIGYLRGNIAKYLHRWRYKNGIEDLKKAQWYQNKLIEVVGNDDNL
jgi:hypothetical protein